MPFPYDCREFEDRTLFYINPILSDYILRHNKEYEDGVPLILNFNKTDLRKSNFTDLENVQSISENILYKTNFYKFCEKGVNIK